MKKYAIALRAFGNPDHGQDPHREVCPSFIECADTLDELREALFKWEATNCLGAGNVPPIKVLNCRTLYSIGTLYYNGRFEPSAEENKRQHERRWP